MARVPLLSEAQFLAYDCLKESHDLFVLPLVVLDHGEKLSKLYLAGPVLID